MLHAVTHASKEAMESVSPRTGRRATRVRRSGGYARKGHHRHQCRGRDRVSQYAMLGASSGPLDLSGHLLSSAGRCLRLLLFFGLRLAADSRRSASPRWRAYCTCPCRGMLGWSAKYGMTSTSTSQRNTWKKRALIWGPVWMHPYLAWISCRRVHNALSSSSRSFEEELIQPAAPGYYSPWQRFSAASSPFPQEDTSPGRPPSCLEGSKLNYSFFKGSGVNSGRR